MAEVTPKNIYLGMTVKPGKNWNPSGKNMWKYGQDTLGTVVTYVNKGMFKSHDEELNNTPCDDDTFKDWCIVMWDTVNGPQKGIYSIGATYPLGKWWTHSDKRIGEGGGYGPPCYNLSVYRPKRTNSFTKLLSNTI
tara:strand:- start:1539 stop:1946 length:408 start_codon:yes stop_codon:yes gene_type:complete